MPRRDHRGGGTALTAAAGALAARARAARRFDPDRFIPFEVDGRSIGHVRRDLATRLRGIAPGLRVEERAVGFAPGVAGAPARSDVMAAAARGLAGRGLLSRWRDECFDVAADPGAEPLFRIERAAVRFFGFTSAAVHVTGRAETADGAVLWIARRSLDKPLDPGLWDTLVGGGLAAGHGVRGTLLKEAWEEAGIAAELAGRATPLAAFRVLREVPEGLHAEIVYLHELLLPGDFEPHSVDGEVAAFRRVRPGALAEELAGDGDYTVCAGVALLLQLRGIGSLPAAVGRALDDRVVPWVEPPAGAGLRSPTPGGAR